MLNSTENVRIQEDLSNVAPQQWNALTEGNPFLRHEFLQALHETGCASEGTGWAPRFITVWNNQTLRAAMPLYLKAHSYGEYVFDWAWADAYQRHGLTYYPKLLSAVPFSPVQGPRLLATDEPSRVLLLKHALHLAEDYSSFHVLFPAPADASRLAATGLQLRRGYQFHWVNPGYASFEDFLKHLNHDKRKKIRQERRKVQEAGIRFVWRCGSDIRSEDWLFFSRCYKATYRAHHSTPYLNRAFFERLGQTMPENLMMVIAEARGIPIACALNVHNERTLFGRYWGTTRQIPNLHFETCYYQAIEFCIVRRLAVFEGGAQGEHKLSRGFLPVPTCSAHWLKHPQFSEAVERFLDRETAGIDHYLDELNERSPFRKG